MQNIRDWQTRLGTIYANDKRTPDYLMVHLSTRCSDISKAFLHQSRHLRRSVDGYVVGAISWMCAICNHFGLDYEKALIQRFPGICTYCIKRPCQCSETNRLAFHPNSATPMSTHDLEHEIEGHRNSYLNSGLRWSFDQFRQELHKIYPANRLFVRSGYFSYPLGKLDEERGELHRAYSAYLRGEKKKSDIEKEVADVTAWLVSLWGLDDQTKSLDTELANTFRLGCPQCKREKCECPTYSISADDEDLIRAAIQHLRDLQAQKQLPEAEIERAVQLVRTLPAESPASRRTTVGVIRGVLDKARQLPNASEGVRKTVESFEKVTDSIGRIFGG